MCRRGAPQVHAEAERKEGGDRLRERAERELAAELERQAATEEERERLRADLVRQETERKNASQRKRALAAKLKGMENKLLKGRCARQVRTHGDSCPSDEKGWSLFRILSANRGGGAGAIRERGRRERMASAWNT